MKRIVATTMNVMYFTPTSTLAPLSEAMTSMYVGVLTRMKAKINMAKLVEYKATTVAISIRETKA